MKGEVYTVGQRDGDISEVYSLFTQKIVITETMKEL